MIDRTAFIRANTMVLAPPLVPEAMLHLAHEAVLLWQKTEEELGGLSLPPPFWAFAWAGGQALARYLLDHPEIVRGRSAVDLAAGSGLVGIAALKAGAASVLAADIDPFAVAAIGLNAQLNGIPPLHKGDGGLRVTSDDLFAAPPGRFDLILVGDLFYEKELAARCFAWLADAQAQGCNVMIGDPGRSYLPRDRLVSLASYDVPVTRDLEDAEIKRSQVWRIRNC